MISCLSERNRARKDICEYILSVAPLNSVLRSIKWLVPIHYAVLLLKKRGLSWLRERA
jgi:hypothetical protein